MRNSRIINKLTILFGLIILLSSLQTPLSAASVTITQVAVVDFGDNLFDVDLEGDYAYVTDYGQSLMHSIDISDPEDPKLISNLSVYLPHYFEVKDGIAYISSWTEGLQIFNVSDPINAVKLGEFVGLRTGAVGIHEDLAFVGRDDGFNILDVSNPSNPVNLSRIIRNGNAHNFFIEETYAYILVWNHTSSSSNLEVYDYTDPNSPLLVAFYDTTKLCYDVKVQNDIVYLAGAYEGLSIVDLTDFSNPTLIGEYDEDEQSIALVVVDDTVFLGNDISGLQLFDVSDKTTPVLIAEYETEGYAQELEIRNEYIYLITEGVGLEILKVRGLGLEESAGFPIFITITVLITLTSLFSLRKKKK